MTREEAIKEIEKAFEPAFANYIITALTEGTTVSEQEPKSEWERDHEILKAYSNGANEVLDRIRAEIKSKITKKPHLNFTIRERERNDAFLEVLDTIDKYKAGSEGNNV